MPQNPDLRFKPPVPVLRVVGETQDKYGNRFRVLVTGPEDSVETYLHELPLALEIHESPPEDPELIDFSPPESTLDVEILPFDIRCPRPYIVHISIDKDIGQGKEQNHGPFDDVNSADLTFTVNQGSVEFVIYEQSKWGFTERKRKTIGPVETVNGTVKTIRITIWDLSISKQYYGRWKIKACGLSATNDYAITGDLTVT